MVCMLAISVGGCATVDMTAGAMAPPPPPPTAQERRLDERLDEHRSVLAALVADLSRDADARGWAPGAADDFSDFTRTLAHGRERDERGPIEVYLDHMPDERALAIAQILNDATEARVRGARIADAAESIVVVGDVRSNRPADLELVERALIALKRSRNTFEGAAAHLQPDPMTESRAALATQLAGIDAQIERLDTLAERLISSSTRPEAALPERLRRGVGLAQAVANL
jgi:hypothetical protein